MSPAPVFSIVVPTHNYGHYLPATLQSVFGQGRADVEVIVVDDASTDDTPEVVDAYGERVRSVRLEENVGPGRAWAIGLAQAAGTYVCKLDADDWQLPGYLDSVEAAFRSDSQVGMVVGGVLEYGEGNPVAMPKPVTAADATLAPDELRARLLRSFFFRMPAVCLRREALENHDLPNADLWLGHDWEYFLRVTRGWGCRLLAAPLAVYRMHRASVTRTAHRDDALRRDVALFLTLVREPANPAYLADPERAVFALGLAETYLKIAGGGGGVLRHPVRAAADLFFALRLAVSERPRNALPVARLAAWGVAEKVRRMLGPSSPGGGVPIEEILPVAAGPTGPGPL